MIQGRADGAGHIGADELAAYLDRTLPDADRRRVEAHLSSCDECRAELIASRDAVASAPCRKSPSFRSWGVIGTAVAAAAVIIATSIISRSRPDRSIERDPNVAAAAVTVASPADGSSLGADRIVAWHRLADNTSYRITVADQSAQPIYTTTVRDTSAVIPPSIALARGGKYFWYVDAIRADGTTATSGLKSFSVK
jgi:hypothetical protein